MTEYKEPGSVLKGNRIFAQARHIKKPHQIKTIESGHAIIYKATKLVQSAFCVIEKPMVSTGK